MDSDDDMIDLTGTMLDTSGTFVVHDSTCTEPLTITLGENESDTVTFDSSALGIDLDWIADINLNDPVLWEDKLPKIAKLKKMCSEYPALEKAYENFKSIYNMVDQDYKGKLKERGEIDDDDIPF